MLISWCFPSSTAVHCPILQSDASETDGFKCCDQSFICRKFRRFAKRTSAWCLRAGWCCSLQVCPHKHAVRTQLGAVVSHSRRHIKRHADGAPRGQIQQNLKVANTSMIWHRALKRARAGSDVQVSFLCDLLAPPNTNSASLDLSRQNPSLAIRTHNLIVQLHSLINVWSRKCRACTMIQIAGPSCLRRGTPSRSTTICHIRCVIQCGHLCNTTCAWRHAGMVSLRSEGCSRRADKGQDTSSVACHFIHFFEKKRICICLHSQLPL